MRNDQKQKYRNFGILSAASALVIGGTVLAENYTVSRETASSTTKKVETVASTSSVKKSTTSVEKTSEVQEASEETVTEVSVAPESETLVQVSATPVPASSQESLEVTPLARLPQKTTLQGQPM